MNQFELQIKEQQNDKLELLKNDLNKLDLTILKTQEKLEMLKKHQKECFMKNKEQWNAQEEDCQDLRNILIYQEAPGSEVEEVSVKLFNFIQNILSRYENSKDVNQKDLEEWDKAYAETKDCENLLKQLARQRLDLVKEINKMSSDAGDGFDDISTISTKIDFLRDHNHKFNKELNVLMNEIMKKKRTLVKNEKTTGCCSIF